MKYFLILFCIFLVGCNLIKFDDGIDIPISTHYTDIEGQKRFYKVFIPSTSNDLPKPLIIILHGNGGNGSTMIKETKWYELATAHQFIVVAPEASRPYPHKARNQRDNRQTWNDGSGRFHSGEQNINDVLFIQTIISEMCQNHNIDTERVFATGFSNGASMTFRLAQEAPEIKGIAPVAGINWLSNQKPNHSIPMVYIVGAEDMAKPLGGGVTKAANGKVLEQTPKPPIRDMIDNWAQLNVCNQNPIAFSISNGVDGIRFVDCNNQVNMEYIVIDDLGHIWPGARRILPKSVVGNASNKLNATNYIWNFFNNINSTNN